VPLAEASSGLEARRRDSWLSYLANQTIRARHSSAPPRGHGPLEPAEAILAAHRELRSGDLHIAAVLGDDTAVRRFLAEDPNSVSATSPPYGGDALNYLCLSKYLRLDPSRSAAFRGVPYPCGYAEVDDLLRAHGAQETP
jgi:hypothetical protein